MNMTNIAALYHSGICINFSYRRNNNNKNSNNEALMK